MLEAPGSQLPAPGRPKMLRGGTGHQDHVCGIKYLETISSNDTSNLAYHEASTSMPFVFFGAGSTGVRVGIDSKVQKLTLHCSGG